MHLEKIRCNLNYSVLDDKENIRSLSQELASLRLRVEELQSEYQNSIQELSIDKIQDLFYDYRYFTVEINDGKSSYVDLYFMRTQFEEQKKYYVFRILYKQFNTDYAIRVFTPKSNLINFSKDIMKDIFLGFDPKNQSYNYYDFKLMDESRIKNYKSGLN